MKKHTQRGQATIELAVMLLALAVTVLGVLFVCGIATGSNDRLLSAKLNAELRARNSVLLNETTAVSEYVNWDYGDYQFKEKQDHSVRIPFSPQDEPRYRDGDTLIELSNAATSAGYSANQEFRWTNPAEYADDFSTSLNTGLVSALDAARLVSGSPSNSENTLKKFVRGEKAETTAYEWLGIKVTGDELDNIPSNQVFMPSIKQDLQ